jgi:hypothetical protein
MNSTNERIITMITDISTLTKISEGRVATENASSYLRKLCQHWAHKFPVKYDDTHGKIDLAAGKCILFADAAGLTVKLMMPEDGDELRLQQVVEEHIKRFAFKETLEFAWGPVAAESSMSKS